MQATCKLKLDKHHTVDTELIKYSAYAVHNFLSLACFNLLVNKFNSHKASKFILTVG